MIINNGSVLNSLLKSVFTGSNYIVSEFEKKYHFAPAIFERMSVLK